MPGHDRHDEPEVLAGGVANAGAVIRIGDHVLRPSTPHTSSIHAHLRDLHERGFEGVPRPLGVDPDGRERLGFIAGDVALPPYPDWVQRDDSLASIATLLRRFHEASRSIPVETGDWSEELADPEGGQVLCHNDVCLENVVFRDGVAVALLDFDFAAPGRPLYDLAQFARMCLPIDDEVDARRLGWAEADRAARFRVVTDAYGLDRAGRSRLLDITDQSMMRGREFVRRRVESGDPNFVAMWNDMGGDERFDRRLSWFTAERRRFEAARA